MKNLVPTLLQDVDVIAHASEHVAFIRMMLQKHSTSEERRSGLLDQINLAEQRASDPVLHLAVLGEFSSGKSTFINALLKQRLLKSSRVATTASATHITFGATLKVTATFLGGSRIQATALDTVELSRAIARIKPSPAEILPIRKAIDLITADQAIANAIKRVDISLPNRHLQAGLSIIDTPGIGAGGDYTKTHSQITQAVVEKSADAAIVLIPSAQPMSHTLISFLQNTASHFLHRCIFVVTAMDNPEKEDKQKILGFVRQYLTEKLGLHNPMVYECAAIAALPTAGKIPVHKQASWNAWRHQFSRLESSLFQEIVRQRTLIISEKLIHLFQALLLELEADVQTRQAVIERGSRQLQEHSIEALESVLTDLLEMGMQTIRIQGNQCRVRAIARKSDLRSRIRTKARALIDSADRNLISNYSSAVEPKLVGIAETEGQKILQETESDMRQLKQHCRDVSDEFRQQFESSYASLTSLSGGITIPAVTVSTLKISSASFSSAGSFAQQVKQKDTSNSGTGAYIGAALGFLVMGPVGAAAGAALGGVTRSSHKTSIEECRQGIKRQLDTDINRYVDRYADEVTRAVDTFKQNALSDLQAIAQAHLLAYGAVVDDMLKTHKEKEYRLIAKAKDVSRDRDELTQRRLKLEALNAKLRTA